MKEKIRLPEIKIKFRLLLYFVTLIFCILSVAETVCGYFPFAVEIVIYVAAAISLVFACFYLVKDMKRGMKGIARSVIEGNMLANRVYSDYRYRTVLFTSFSFVLNLFYAAGNGVYAVISHSPWMGTFSAYYIFLSIMRYGIIQYDRTLSKERDGGDLGLQEVKVYRSDHFRCEYNTCKENEITAVGDNPKYWLCGCAGIRSFSADRHVWSLWGGQRYRPGVNEWDHRVLCVRDDTGDWDLYDTLCGQAERKNAGRHTKPVLYSGNIFIQFHPSWDNIR